MLRSVKNDAHFIGGRGISTRMLEKMEEKPSVMAKVQAERQEQMQDASSMSAELTEHTKSDKVVTSEETEESEEAEYQRLLLSPDDSILILTGANASGKSVFLKTVAMIVFMVHLISDRLLPFKAFSEAEGC